MNVFRRLFTDLSPLSFFFDAPPALRSAAGFVFSFPRPCGFPPSSVVDPGFAPSLLMTFFALMVTVTWPCCLDIQISTSSDVSGSFQLPVFRSQMNTVQKISGKKPGHFVRWSRYCDFGLVSSIVASSSCVLYAIFLVVSTMPRELVVHIGHCVGHRACSRRGNSGSSWRRVGVSILRPSLEATLWRWMEMKELKFWGRVLRPWLSRWMRQNFVYELGWINLRPGLKASLGKLRRVEILRPSLEAMQGNGRWIIETLMLTLTVMAELYRWITANELEAESWGGAIYGERK